MITEVEALRKARGIRANYHQTEQSSPPPTYDDDGDVVMPDSDKNNHHHHHHHHHQEHQQQHQQQQHYRFRRRVSGNDDDDDSGDSNLQLDSMRSSNALMAANTLANWSSPAPLSSGTGSDIDVLDASPCATIDLSNHLKRKDVFNSRKQREFIPDNKKDESYWDRRRRNNEAAKRSREKRRLNDMVLESRVFELTKENTYLRAQLMAIREKYGIVGENLVTAEQLSITMPVGNESTNQVALNLTKRAKLLSPLLNTGSAPMMTPNGQSSIALRSLVMASAAAAAIHQQPMVNNGAASVDLMVASGKLTNNGRHYHVEREDYGDYWRVKSEDQIKRHVTTAAAAAIVADDQRCVAVSVPRENLHHLLQSPSSHNHDALLGALNGRSSSIYGADHFASPPRDNYGPPSSPMALTVDNADYNQKQHQRHADAGLVQNSCCSDDGDDDDDDDEDEDDEEERSVRGQRYSNESTSYAPPLPPPPPTSVTPCDNVQQLHLPHKLRHKPRLSECSVPAVQSNVTNGGSVCYDTRQQRPIEETRETVSDEDMDAAPSVRRRKRSVFEQQHPSMDTMSSSPRPPTPASAPAPPAPAPPPPPPPPPSSLKVENSQLKLEMKRLAVEVANLKDMLLFNNKSGASSNKSDTSSRDSGFATDGEPERDRETTPT